MLGDKEADRQIARDQIHVQARKSDHDFEAKLANVAMQLETKLAAVAQKMEQGQTAAFHKSMQMLTEEVKRMETRFDQQQLQNSYVNPINKLATAMGDRANDESDIEFRFNDEGRPIGARRRPVPKPQ
jgi:hypothetical protein